jgi:hypothetical protein
VSQIPNSKLQQPKKLQISSFNLQKISDRSALVALRVGCFGISLLEFLWSLVLGIWSFGPLRPPLSD